MRSLARLLTPVARPLAGHRWFGFWAVVHHRGRRSGRAYATPIVARRTPEGFVIPLPFGERTQWLQNVRAAGRCTIRWGGREYAVAEPEVIDLERAGAAFRSAERVLARLAGIDMYLRLRLASPGPPDGTSGSA